VRDVDPQLYPTVIREMYRHENDVTNHRIMWLLIVQGLIANAAVTAGKESGATASAFATVGILVTLSAFIILYKSYQARGYLQFLGNEAKRGTLREQDLPLFGWPSKRIKGWRKKDLALPLDRKRQRAAGTVLFPAHPASHGLAVCLAAAVACTGRGITRAPECDPCRGDDCRVLHDVGLVAGEG
jgi:hypothetical protein